MEIKRVIELEADTLKRIDEAKSVPDMFGTDIVNGLNAIRYGKPYNPSEDCISRSDVKDKMKKAEEQADTFEMLVEFYEQIIDNTQAVEPKRSKGEWLHNSDRPDTLICSVCNCGWDMWRYESKELKYCPNCGADMRGGEQENEQ